MATNAERIALLVELATADFNEKLGRDLAAFTAQLALNNGLANSRRWVGFADLLANSARSYIDDLATKIRAIEAGGSALATYSNAVESLLAHLDSKYQSAWAKDAPWRLDKDAPPPPAWQSTKAQLNLAFQVQQSEFDPTIIEPVSVPDGEKGQQWKRFDDAVNLVAWLLTSPKAPTDYSRAGARNLARLVNETKVRCRAGSIANIRLGISTSLDPESREGQSQLRLITSCVADAIVQGSQRLIPPDRTVGSDLLAAIRNAPHSFPPQALEWLKAADQATGKVGRPEEITRAYFAFAHAFDTLEDLHGATEGRPWQMTSCDRTTSSYSFAFDDDGTTIDVMGLQFSYADMQAVLGEKAEDASRPVASQPPESDEAVESQPVSLANAEPECVKWLEAKFKAGMGGNKTSLKADAQASIKGLSGKAFLRAWDAVAPRFNRNQAGRPGKSDPRNHSPK